MRKSFLNSFFVGAVIIANRVSPTIGDFCVTSHSPTFCAFVRLTLVSLGAFCLINNAFAARALEETPARLEALAQEETEEKEAPEAVSEATPEVSFEAEDAIDEPVPSRLLGSDTRQALIADSAFLSARTAFRKNHPEALKELSQQTKGHPLYGYVELWNYLLQLKNGKANPSVLSELSHFATEHADQYVGERAQGELARFYGLNDDVKNFEARWAKLTWQASEADLRCLRAAITLRTKNTKKALDEAKKTIVASPVLQERACQKLVSATLAASPKWSWDYLLILLQKNKIRLAKEFLNSPASTTLPVQASALKTVLANPKNWYAKNKKRLSRVASRQLAVAAIAIARSDTQAASLIAGSASARLDAATRTLMWGHIAYQAALNHDKKAPRYYQRAGNTLRSLPILVNREAVLSWHVRAYLREMNWPLVLKTIGHLPTSIAKDSTWVYWRARALWATKRKTQAKELYKKISHEQSFYGLLARDALNLPYEKGMITLNPPLTAEKKASFDSNPHIERARRFYALDLFYEGNREWAWAMRTMGKRERLELAQFALDIGLTHRAINTSASTGVLVRNLVYPKAHEKAVREAARVAGLSEDWLFGLIRQESRFISTAKSSVGALGLMQVMPRTARWVAKKLALKNYQDDALTKLDTNLVIGAQYLKLVSDNFEGSIPLSCAGYNAGPSRAVLWRSRLKRTVDGAIFAETIPFTETRGYVKHVAANTAQYMFGKPDKKTLTEILGKVSPQPNAPVALP